MRSRTGSACLAAILASVLVASIAPVALAAPPAPRLVSPQPGQVVKGNPILKWRDAPGAVSYEVDFAQNGIVGYSAVTSNNKLVPPIELPLGSLTARVTSFDARGARGGSARVTFQKVSANAPILVTPESGATLDYPFDPPLFSWEPVTGATRYKLEIDDAPNFIGATEIETESTYHVFTDAQTIGQTFYWRVTGILQNEVNTARSQVRTYRISWNAAPQLVFPPNTTATPIEDVVLEWNPVVGASTYQVQISPNGDWANNVILEVDVKSTRFSPTPTLNNASYFWRVRAKDKTTNVTPWSEEWQFRRAWPDKPAILSPGVGETTTDPFFSWTPVDHAAYYQIEFATDANFSPANVKETGICTTDHTRFTPFQRQPCAPDPLVIQGGQTYFWRVKGMDPPGGVNVDEGGVNGIYSEPSRYVPSFRDASGPFTGTVSYPSNAVACATFQGACVETPTLRWNHLAGANQYAVYVALDPAFTNILEEYSRVTPFNTYTPPMSLLDNQAGESYYWFVRPCDEGVSLDDLRGCGVFDNTVFHLAQSFRKKSLPVELFGPAEDARVENQISFTWKDHLETNLGVGGTDEAKQYRIQVSTTADFSNIIDAPIVDQTTYTPFAETYPEGPLFWRVQAIDNSDNNLTFSQTRRVVKASPPIELTRPGSRATLRGVPVFKWAPQPYASSYEIEIYRERDLEFSPVNLVASQITQMTAWAPAAALEPGDYSWRVRGLDVDGQPRSWSDGRAFQVIPNAPTLVAPDRGARITDNPLFRWKGTAQAAEYEWVVATDVGLRDIVQSQRTVMTSWAPTSSFRPGTYYWAVRPIDVAGAAGPRSAIRSFIAGSAPAGGGQGSRSISFNLEGHLTASGVISAVRPRCLRGRVHIERFNGASWLLVKTIRSSTGGRFQTRIRDVFGNYRARMDRVELDGRTCNAAISNVERHRH